MEREELKALAEAINKVFTENRLYVDVFVDWDNDICYQIDWGDWKHEHLRADWLVKEFLNGLGYRYLISEETTEEDGSDTYSAEHRVMLIGRD